MTTITSADPTPTPDLAAIKTRQQATWSSGDYHMIGTQIQIVSELLIEALDVHSTERVLDVATGSGNAALAAARRGCDVTGVDYVPALLDRARLRAQSEELRIEFVEGDAEALPFPDGGFDVVTSVFGSMFAPNQEKTAAELARVVKPGGRIGIVAHTPDGFIGNLFKVIGKHAPPPAGLRSPIQWGTEARLRELFIGRIADLKAEKRFYTFRDRSPQHYIEYWRTYYGPTLKAFEALDADGGKQLHEDLVDLATRHNVATDGTAKIPSAYVQVLATRV